MSFAISTLGRGPVSRIAEFHLLHRIIERYWEWKLGIRTNTRDVPDAQLLPDSKPYEPVPYLGFRMVMNKVPTHLLYGTFVDYGCGFGRALVMAEKFYGFPRIVGVEYSPEFCAIAKANRDRLHSNWEIVCNDAAAYTPSNDVSVFFLCNPFGGETMRRVIARIHDSVSQHPRDWRIVVCNFGRFRQAADSQQWLRLEQNGTMTPGMSWAIYRPA